MIRTLEIAWLCITIISFGLTIFQFFKEGIQSGLFMLAVTAIASAMYTVRRKQRIKFEQKDEKELYH